MRANLIVKGLACAALWWLVVLVVHFPYQTDPPISRTINRNNQGANVEFYNRAYTSNSALGTDKPDVYAAEARRVADNLRIKDRVGMFVETCGLDQNRALEVGAGSGYLQDIVTDYTGLDISASAARYFHKPFVQASATDIPFPDNSFDIAWSIWTLEHVVHPEHALLELRRVVRNGGCILMVPTWLCPPWAADGYPVRPYSDFGIGGRLIKASIPLRSAPLFEMTYTIPVRIARLGVFALDSPLRLHYRLLTPNYDKYWMADSDAVNSLDWFEVSLWFKSRGDECLNCLTRPAELLTREHDVAYRVRK